MGNVTSSSSVQPEVRIDGKYWEELTSEQKAEYKKDVLQGMFRDVCCYDYALLTKQGDLGKWRPFVKGNELDYYKRVGFYLIEPPPLDILVEWCEEVFDFPFTLHRYNLIVWVRRVYGVKATYIQSVSLPPSSQSTTDADCPQTQDHQTPPS